MNIPVWILGSSLFGAQLAAQLGLPYAFASHFAPHMMMDAIETYQSEFRPSKWLAAPYLMLGFNVFAAETDEEAQFLATSLQQAFIALRTGKPGKLQPPIPGYAASQPTDLRALLNGLLRCSAIGSAQTVLRQTREFVDKTGADELMVTSQIFDHSARLRSYEILAHTFEVPTFAAGAVESS